MFKKRDYMNHVKSKLPELCGLGSETKNINLPIKFTDYKEEDETILDLNVNSSQNIIDTSL